MRRSSQVTAPLLACAAAACLIGCMPHNDCTSTPTEACAAAGERSQKTIFGGFGTSFAEHADEIAVFAVAGAILISFGS